MPQAVRHHYVPKFLLRPWLVGEESPELVAYWWDSHKHKLTRKAAGPNGFAQCRHLLTLNSGNLPPDALEKRYFGDVIDDRGAKVRDKIVGQQYLQLNAHERSDFARFLLSLDARRPENVARLRAMAGQLRNELDSDIDVVEAIRSEGFDMLPSRFVEEVLKQSFDDEALLIIQRIVDNSDIGPKLLRMHWQVKHLGDHEGRLILSDRPLIRIGAVDDPNAAWALPLSPICGFVACANAATAERVSKLTGNRFRKLLNVSSANQADRFAFTVNDADSAWLGKYLKGPEQFGNSSSATD